MQTVCISGWGKTAREAAWVMEEDAYRRGVSAMDEEWTWKKAGDGEFEIGYRLDVEERVVLSYDIMRVRVHR